MKTISLLVEDVSKLRWPPECCCCLANIDEAESRYPVELRTPGSDLLHAQQMVPACAICKTHWALAVAFEEGEGRREKLLAPIAVVLVLGLLADSAHQEGSAIVIHGAVWAFLLLLVCGVPLLIMNRRARPQSEPGHVPFHKKPVSMVGTKRIYVIFQNEAAGANVENMNAELLRRSC